MSRLRHFGRQVFDRDGVVFAEQDRAFESGFELADVAGIRIIFEQAAGVRGDRDLSVGAAGVFFDEIIDQHGNIGPAFAQAPEARSTAR